MNTVTLLIVVVVVVVVVAVVAVAVSAMLRKRRSDRLREEFGPEYERTMRESDDPRDAEADLRRREKQRSKIQLRELDERERADYRDRWDVVQREFVDDPGRAVGQADKLVVDVMSARGYPAEDIDRRADDLSVDYPVITQRYREAREISQSHDAGRADTEDLRHAVTSYRALVNALLDDTDDDRGRDAVAGDRRDSRAELGASPRDDRDIGRYAERDAGRGRDADLDRDGGRDRDGDLDRDGGRGRYAERDSGPGRDADPDRDGGRGRDGGRDADLDGGGGRYAERDAGRGRDADLDRDGARGRDGDPDRDRGPDRDGDRNGGPDRDADPDRDGDREGGGRRVRDVLRDKVTGRDRDADVDRDGGRAGDRGPDREPDGGPGAQPWERGRHSQRDSRTDDDPRREATT